ncbi:MAG: hypothetical protein QXT53_06570 [Ignisphaera sp.]
MVIAVGKQKRGIVLSIYNSKILYKVIDLLRVFDITYSGIYDSSCVESDLADYIILVDDYGISYLKSINCALNGIIIRIDESTIEKNVILALALSRIDRRVIEVLIAGIDYGLNIGLALFADSELIFAKSYRSDEMVINMLKIFFESIPAKKKIIRIGIPSKLIQSRLAKFIDNLLKELPRDILIELVHEHKTSRHSIIVDDNLDEDSIAAINIALKAFQKH